MIVKEKYYPERQVERYIENGLTDIGKKFKVDASPEAWQKLREMYDLAVKKIIEAPF